MPTPTLSRALAAALVGLLALPPAAAAQRRIIGATPSEEEDPPPAASEKAQKEGEKSGKKKAEPKPPDDRRDVLEDTAAEEAAREKAEQARAKAEQAAEEAAAAARAKKEQEQQRLLEEKQAAEDKRRQQVRQQRLTAAQKVRQLARSTGEIGVAIAIEPGQVKKDRLVEVRFDLARRLEVPDPRFGNLMPVRGASLVATVIGPEAAAEAKRKGGAQKGPPTERRRYLVHALSAPGRYGFHTTPLADGAHQIEVTGKGADGKALSFTFPLHVGVWPPPDFDREDENNDVATASAGGRKILGSP